MARVPSNPRLENYSHISKAKFIKGNMIKNNNIFQPISQSHLSQQPHFCNLVTFSSLPISQQQTITLQATYTEPHNYHEAILDPGWKEAMDKEISALHKNETWEYTDLPPGKKAIGSKWVYKAKHNKDGSLERLKARLVIQGNHQKYGIDYLETFSPVVKMTTIRTIIALTAARKWNIYQLDVNNAFLHGSLQEDVYVRVPLGITNPHNKVCKLKKSIYGLKQASRQWFQKLAAFLNSRDYQQSKSDPSLFVKQSSSYITILAVYVDDILLNGSNSTEIDSIKRHLEMSSLLRILVSFITFLEWKFLT